MELHYKVIFGAWESVAKSIGGGTIDLCVTSPPYYDMRGTVRWINYTEYLNACATWFKEIYRVLKRGRIFALNVPTFYIDTRKEKHTIGLDLINIARNARFTLNEEIIWKKPEGMAHGAAKRFGTFVQYSYPFYYWPNIITERIFILSKGEMKDAEYDRLAEQSEVDLDDVMDITKNDIWYMPTSSQENPWNVHYDSSQHPAMFPVLLPDLIIRFYSYVGEAVLDPFIGSGTCIIAARKNRRSCIGVEINRDLLDLIKTKTKWGTLSLIDELNYEVIYHEQKED